MKPWPSIDHSILSPSGRVSKRARAAALERARRELFGDGLQRPQPQPDESEAKYLRDAKMYRDFAARGFKPRVHTREAERCERLAAEARAKEAK